jgi:cyclic-di-GMP-binding protein
MPSFDIVSEVNMQEVENAINQARKEIGSRYDFKGSNTEIQWDKEVITIQAEDDYKIGAMKEILQGKMHKRGIDIGTLKFEKVEQAGGRTLKQKVLIQQGIETEKAKEILKSIKDAKLKVQAQIQDEKVRVTSKSIDELQETMALLRSKTFGLPLQFNNMR